MPVTVVLAEGFAGEVVDVVAGGQTYLVGPAHTSLLTGMAGEVVVDPAPDGDVCESDRIEFESDRIMSDRIMVAARLTRTVGEAPWTSFWLAEGDVLVLDVVGGELAGRVVPGPVGFA